MAPKAYKGAIYRGIGSVDVVELPWQSCGDDDIIVKNLMAGLCGSDIEAFKYGGDPVMVWKDHEMGHEVVSEVLEVGKNVKDIQVGDYVFPNQGSALRDRRRMCTVGAFSQYIYIPQFEKDFSVVMLDKTLPLKSLALLEPFVIGGRGAKSTSPGPGKTAVVFGAGIVGMSAAIMLKWYGCDKIMIVDIADYRLKNARTFGFATCNPQTEDLKAKAISEFGLQRCYSGEVCGANIYIDATGVNQTVEEHFVQIANRDAYLAVVGIHHHPVTLNFINFVYNNWHFGGSGDATVFDMAVEVQNMMKSGKFDLSRLVSHTYNLDDIVEAFQKAGTPTEAQKVCLTFE